MCLAIPGELLDIDLSGALPMGRVSFGGAIKQICLCYTPDASAGDYVLAHAGFALCVIDEARASQIITDIGAVMDGGAI